MVQNLDIHCFRNHCPPKNTIAKMQTQRTTVKKYHPEKSIAKDIKLVHVNAVEFSQ